MISTLSGKVDDLGNALHFVGTGSELPGTGNDGDVFIGTGGDIDGKEYVYSDGAWEEFGSGDHITQAQAQGLITAAIGALDGSITGTAGAGKTLTALSQTDGVVSATFGDIAITQSQVSGLTDTLGTFATTSALNAAIAGLDKTDAAVANQYVTAVSETDGVISVTRKQISYNELTDKPTIATPAAGKLLGADGTEIFNANQTGDSTIIVIDCGSATDLVD